MPDHFFVSRREVLLVFTSGIHIPPENLHWEADTDIKKCQYTYLFFFLSDCKVWSCFPRVSNTP